MMHGSWIVVSCRSFQILKIKDIQQYLFVNECLQFFTLRILKRIKFFQMITSTHSRKNPMLTDVTATMMLRMVPPVLPCILAAFWNKNCNFLSKYRTKIQVEWLGNKEISYFFLRSLLAPMFHKVPPEIPRSLAVFWNESFKIFQLSQQIPYFRRGRKMSKNKNQVTL